LNKETLDFVLNGEIDQLLNKEILKVYLPLNYSSISEIARKVSPLNMLYKDPQSSDG
jgi:hypothetical protein